MARPTKEGIDYFPLDVKMDDTIALIEAEHGIVGFAIVIKLFQKIYSEGYFYFWTEKEQLLFSKIVSVDRNTLVSIVSDAIKWGLFNQELYEKYQILTSKGIQKRYFSIIYKRANIEVLKEYLLMSVEDKKNIKVVSILDDRNTPTSIVSDDRNTPTSIVSDIESTQSKVKESKVKEEEEKNDFKIIIEYFNQNIHPITQIEAENLNDWLNKFDSEVIILAINEAVLNDARRMKYIDSILIDWDSTGLKTKESVDLYLKKWKENKNIKGGNNNNEHISNTQGKNRINTDHMLAGDIPEQDDSDLL